MAWSDRAGRVTCWPAPASCWRSHVQAFPRSSPANGNSVGGIARGGNMHVGMSSIFQGFGGTLSDKEVWDADLHMADLAEPLGYQSIWSVEHHFTNYTMCPDVLHLLTSM